MIFISFFQAITYYNYTHFVRVFRCFTSSEYKVKIDVSIDLLFSTKNKNAYKFLFCAVRMYESIESQLCNYEMGNN